ncbi:MAG TPA: hypothetical protein VLE89_05505 [Chlamydiales bacterium]|nr:hypothetical protein [Chlamydiales bacterium]
MESMILKKWVAIGGALSILGFASSVFSNMSLADESWFLQVAHRVGRGEVLYGDVFFGVTPLSVYLTVLFTKCFGIEILVLKGINAMIFASTVLLCCYSLHQLDKQKFSWNLALSLCLLYPSGVVGGYGSVYNPLANLFFVGCLASLLRHARTLKFRSLIGAAACAALCFGSKQNTGLLAFLALTVVAGIYQSKRTLVWIWGVFALISILILLPVLYSGEWESFLDYAFLNKTIYAQKGRIAYFSYAHFCIFPACLLFSLPLMVLGTLAYIFWKDREPQRVFTAILWVFCFASFLAIFPRADDVHLLIAIPMMLIGLIYGGRRIMPQFPWNGKAITLGLSLLVLYTPAKEVHGLIRGNRVMLTLNHFHGACVFLDLQKMIETRLEALKSQIPEKGPIFFLSPFAGFYYLALEIPNPTPFDFPFVTAFGKRGQERVISELARGMIQSVIVDDELNSEMDLQPTQLYDYVRRELHRNEPGELGPQLHLYRK